MKNSKIEKELLSRYPSTYENDEQENCLVHIIVNKLKKLIAKTLLYLNFVESDEFLRLTFYLIWTNDVKFAKKKKLERRCPMS